MSIQFLASPLGTRNAGYDVQYLIADWSAEGDGSDDSPEMIAYGNYAEALPASRHMLILNSGYTFGTPGGGAAQFWHQGVRELVVEGTGATVTVTTPGNLYDFGSGVGFGVLGASQQAMIATVAAGSSTCTLLDGGDASKLTVGNYVCICGLRTQPGGDPPNMHWFEHIKVAGVSGTTVTFDRPLRNTYKSTWPEGGAARLLTSTSWDQYIEHRGYTIDQVNGGHSRSRDIRLRDMTFIGLGFTPTTSSTMLVEGCTGTTAVPEVDKLIEVLVIRNSTFPQLYHQSSASSVLLLDNTALTRTPLTALNGTPRHTIITNGCDIELLTTGVFYGCSKSLVAEDSDIAAWEWGRSGFSEGAELTGWSMTSGVIAFLKTSITYLPWAIPGSVCFFSYGTRRYGPSFEVVDITEDATNVFVTTNLAGGFPTTPTAINAIHAHPCPRLTITNCTGNATVLDLNNAPAGIPGGTWTSRTYTKADSAATIATMPFLVGRIIEIRINVTLAWDDDGSALTSRVFDCAILNPAGTAEDRYQPSVNLRTLGERVITASGVSPVITGDTGLALPVGAAGWLVNGVFAGFNASRNVSAVAGDGFTVTVTVTTDQEADDVEDLDYDWLVATAEALN